MITERPAPGQVHLWICRLDESLDEAEARRDLPAAERLRADRFARPALRRRFAVGRAVLRRLLGGYLGATAAEVVIGESAHGKPFVDGIEFNISHSGELLAMAFRSDAAVGVDIEEENPRLHVREIAERFFAPEEAASLQRLPSCESEFYRLWTAKEAVLKAAGLGLAGGLAGVRVTSAPPQVTALGAQDVSGWDLLWFEPAPGFAGAVASPRPVTALHRFDYGRGSG